MHCHQPLTLLQPEVPESKSISYITKRVLPPFFLTLEHFSLTCYCKCEQRSGESRCEKNKKMCLLCVCQQRDESCPVVLCVYSAVKKYAKLFV